MSEMKEKSETGKELGELINLLKETILELRNLADQLSNPLIPPNIISRESVEREKENEIQKVRKEIVKPEKVVEKSEKVSVKPVAKEIKSVEKVEKEISPMQSAQNFIQPNKASEASKLLRLVKLIYELSDRVPPEYFSKLAEFIGSLGLTSKEQVEALKNLIEIVKMGNEYGLSLEENLALLALTLKELGIKEDEIVDEVLKRVIKRQGVGKWESQQQ